MSKLLCIVFVLLIILTSCINTDDKNVSINRDNKNSNINENSQISNINEKNERINLINSQGKTIVERILPPVGYERIKLENGSFGEFLEKYPLLEHGSKVYLHNGQKKSNQNVHIAVFDMPLVKGDLQQCADSVMRLYAEYFYENKAYDKIKFHFVSGFLCDYESWRNGKRVQVDGNNVAWVDGGEISDSYENFEKYLRTVFAYASTLSLAEESVPKKIEDIEAGDIIIKGGSPGHVVMVLDVCEKINGEKAFLLGQGYMPAQQFHVLKNPKHEDDPWYYENEVTEPFETAEYVFSEFNLRKLNY